MVDIHKKQLIISGPCSAETEEQTIQTAMQLAATGMVDVIRAGVWKPRTKPGGFEGMGLKALSWLAKAKEMTGLPIAVEVATAKHVQSALEFGVDAVWIGARTTGNPFSVQEVAEALRGSGIPVFVKNPMNPDIDLWCGAVARLIAAGTPEENIGLIHRGFSYFGSSDYRNAPMWHLILEMRSRMPHLPMICDPSHICGNRTGLQEVAQKAADLSFDGLIIESHVNPAVALSDASQQLVPLDLARLVGNVNWRVETTDNPAFVQALDNCRREIDQIDSELFSLMARRMNIADKIGEIKRDNNVAILQGGRWGDIVERVVNQSSKLGLSEEFLKTVLNAIHTESINRQNKVMNAKE